VVAVGELESGAQCGSAVKAVYFMERSCPTSSMAPVLAITKMVAASSCTRIKPDPAGEIVQASPTGLSHVECKRGEASMKPSQQNPLKKASCQRARIGWQGTNRKQRREMTRKIQAADLSLEVVHPDAAGIDIGNEAHYVAVPPTRHDEAVRRFGCTTAELRDLASRLKQHRNLPVARM